MHWSVDRTNPRAAVDRVHASLVSSIVLTLISHNPYPHSTQPERRIGGDNSARVKTTCGKNETGSGGRLLIRLFRAGPRLPLPLHWHSASPPLRHTREAASRSSAPKHTRLVCRLGWRREGCFLYFSDYDSVSRVPCQWFTRQRTLLLTLLSMKPVFLYIF